MATNMPAVHAVDGIYRRASRDSSAPSADKVRDTPRPALPDFLQAPPDVSNKRIIIYICARTSRRVSFEVDS
jgi:hypothetical protein